MSSARFAPTAKGSVAYSASVSRAGVLESWLAALVLVAAGCRAPTAAPSAPEQRAEPHDVDYEFELARDTGRAAREKLATPPWLLRVHLALVGDANGETSFELANSWGGVDDPSADVLDFEVRGDGDRAIALEHPKRNLWIAHHSPSAKLKVAYDFAEANHATSLGATDRNYYRVIVEDGLVHLLGSVGLVTPSRYSGGAPCTIGLTWRGFREAGWNVASSFSPDDRPWSARMALGEFTHAVFVGGDIRIFERTIHGSPIYVAIRGTEWGFQDAEFVDLCAKIVETERSFFADFDYPHYLISLIPVGHPDGHSFSLGGTGLTNSFAMFMMPGATVKPGSHDALEVQHVLAHEMFHHWNGNLITLAQPEQRGYWFSEGFTDFYARRLLRRSGRIDDAEFVKELDEKVEHYLLSPVVDAPSSRIEAEFWTNHDVQSIPYERGDVIAMFVDAKIREASGGARSLDDLMRSMVSESRTRNSPFSVDELYQRIGAACDRATAERVRGIADRGELAPIEASWFAPCLTMQVEPRGKFELGFDFEATQSAKSITGVKPGSKAETAGLRDGQSWLGGSIYFNDTHHDVELHVRDEQGERTLRYAPVGAERPVPVFELAGDARAIDCARL